jgi:hypothetical protein
VSDPTQVSRRRFPRVDLVLARVYLLREAGVRIAGQLRSSGEM